MQSVFFILKHQEKLKEYYEKLHDLSSIIEKKKKDYIVNLIKGTNKELMIEKIVVFIITTAKMLECIQKHSVFFFFSHVY